MSEPTKEEVYDAQIAEKDKRIVSVLTTHAPTPAQIAALEEAGRLIYSLRHKWADLKRDWRTSR
jgi:hypothetical protein